MSFILDSDRDEQTPRASRFQTPAGLFSLYRQVVKPLTTVLGYGSQIQQAQTLNGLHLRNAAKSPQVAAPALAAI